MKTGVAAFNLLPQPEIGARRMTEHGEQLIGRTAPAERRTVVGQTP